ncbi:hypothetical protein L218DRAFT_718992 [Marasmius fiardii PR-910]|nr:hypothetical protein L218DRAFT_718992 [Marasmius fiardii PR-910]
MSAFPALREVEISTRFMDEESDHRLFRAIGTSPVLEKLTLFNMDYDMDNIRAVKRSIPWGQLKHLGILAGNSSLPVWILVLRGILQECSTLEHLVVDQSPWDVSAREETSELEAEEGRYPTLSTLRSLDIRKNGRWGDLHEPHLSMWSIGKFPALEHLALSNFNLCQNIAHLNMAFADSCLELRSLTLRDIALSDFTVERFLREHGGHIRVLTLQGQLFDHLFECIAASEGEMFLPNLEKLVVKMDERTVISPSLVALINVIRARASNDGTSRLTAVDVEIYAEDEEIEPVEELEAMNNTELRIQVRRIETVYYDGTEVNEIARFGRFLNTALYRQSWDDIPSSHFHENMPILDNIFTRFENCSSQVYEDRSYVHELSALRHVLEKFVKGVDALPEDYDFAKRAERLLDDRFGWNPNGRKRRR